MAIFGFITLVLITLYFTSVSVFLVFAALHGFSSKDGLLFSLVPTVGLWYAVFHFSPFTLVVS